MENPHDNGEAIWIYCIHVPVYTSLGSTSESDVGEGLRRITIDQLFQRLLAVWPHGRGSFGGPHYVEGLLGPDL